MKSQNTCDRVQLSDGTYINRYYVGLNNFKMCFIVYIVTLFVVLVFYLCVDYPLEISLHIRYFLSNRIIVNGSEYIINLLFMMIIFLFTVM